MELILWLILFALVVLAIAVHAGLKEEEDRDYYNYGREPFYDWESKDDGRVDD